MYVPSNSSISSENSARCSEEGYRSGYRMDKGSSGMVSSWQLSHFRLLLTTPEDDT